MVHLLYKLDPEGGPEATAYRLVKPVKFAGKDSPITPYVIENAKDEHPFGWHMHEAEILKRLGVDASSHATVIDLWPNRSDAVLLFQVKGILGFSYMDWTPICFLLETLIDHEKSEDPAKRKREFLLPNNHQGDKVLSFVYLRGGFQEGSWLWGAIGSVNGAILERDAWRYFDHKLRSLEWFG